MAETFGQTLRHLRRTKGVSQRELAEHAGVDFSYISKVENDRLPPPSADTIVKICEALELPPDELLALTGKIPTKVRETLSASPSAVQFTRLAQTMSLTEEEWREMTQELNRLRSR